MRTIITAVILGTVWAGYLTHAGMVAMELTPAIPDNGLRGTVQLVLAVGTLAAIVGPRRIRRAAEDAHGLHVPAPRRDGEPDLTAAYLRDAAELYELGRRAGRLKDHRD